MRFLDDFQLSHFDSARPMLGTFQAYKYLVDREYDRSVILFNLSAVCLMNKLYKKYFNFEERRRALGDRE